METSDIIASLALLLSIVSMGWTRKLYKQQKGLNDQQFAKNKEEDEAKKKAHLHAQTISGDRRWNIKITNTGNSVARNIQFISEDLEKEGAGIMFFDTEHFKPYPTLHPSSSYNIRVFLNSNHTRRFKITLKWEDEYSKENTDSQTLQF